MQASNRKRIAGLVLIAVAIIFTATVAAGAAKTVTRPLDTADLRDLLRWISVVNVQEMRGSKVLARMVDHIEKQAPGSRVPRPKLEGSLRVDLGTVGTWLKKVAPDAQVRGRLLRDALGFALKSMKEEGTGLHLPNQYMARAEEEGYDKGGVGILVSDEKDDRGRFVVFETLDGFPAQAAGLAAGDRLVKVGGTSVVGASYRQLADLVRGNLGTQVVLTVQRDSDGQTRDIEVQRVWLNPNPKNISHRVIEDGIGYVRFKYLGARMDLELQGAINDFKARNVKAAIIDLRNNEGQLAGSLDVTGSFVPRNTALTTVVTRLKKEAYRTQGFQQPYEVPLVLLVNRYTSGAGVLMAGALRDAGRATLVGEATVWRDQPRDSRKLPDGSVVTVTTGYYVLPRGEVLRARTPSVTPSVVVAQDPLSPLAGASDQQLTKAIEVARSLSGK